MKLLDFWPTEDAITKCVPSEAEVISDEAFLAVHQPIRLLHRSLTNKSAPEEPADERKVLDALLTKNLPEGYVIVPVVGPSGVGKSHLIRWLGLHVPRGKMHVIPIPKSTSLRQILETILKGLQGAGYDEIRRQLVTAREALDETAGRNLLLAHFRTALERRTQAAQEECMAITKRSEKPPTELAGVAQTHGPGLVALLPVALLEGPIKEALLSEEPKKKSVFRTLIKRVTTGIITAENGEFTADDFKFDAVNPATLPDVKLQNYVKKLKANMQNDREMAAKLMNEVRDWAVGQLLGLGENQLADLFRRVREELFKDGKELILLIEDFTTLAGVQQGLLDVIKMEGVRAGEADRCPLRTALAVTEGYLSPYDTLKTRIRYEFVLREQSAAEPELLVTITNMVGAYLNAARLGPERLKEWFEGAARNSDAAPPSFESAANDLSDPDRRSLEAFGKSPRGHSLFPFNNAAVKQLALQHLAAGGPLRLNPRALIKEVLHTTLLYQREAFESGQFPPEGFHKFNANKLGFEVTAWLGKIRPADHGRYAVLLGYWADQPRQPDDVKLPSHVYTAFGLVPLTTVAASISLVVTHVGADRAELQWAAEGVTGEYTVKEHRDKAGQRAVGTTFTIVGLRPTTEYRYEVAARAVGGETVRSNTVTFTTAAEGLIAPAAPIIALSRVSARAVTLGWGACAGTQSYVVSYRPSASGQFVLSGSTPLNTWSVDNLSPDTDYEFTVVARGQGGDSPPSQVSKVRTPADDGDIHSLTAARERMLDEWAESKTITQRDATALRNDLLDMIDWAIDWDAELFIPRDLSPKVGKSRHEDDDDDADEEVMESGPIAGKKHKRARLRADVGPKEVYLPFYTDRTAAGPDEAIFTLCRENVFADPVAFAAVRFELRAMVRFHAHKSFDYPGGDEDRAWYARLADRAAAQAAPYLRKRYERVPDNFAAVSAVAQALYVSARVLDLPGAHSNTDSEIVKAVLDSGPSDLRATTSEDGWQKFRVACATNRATARDFLLRRIAARQGIGNVLYGIDATRLLEALKPVRKSCRVEAKFPGEILRLEENARQVLAFVGEVSAERTAAAVADRRASLVKWAVDTRAWLGKEFRKDLFVADCRELLNQASNLGVFSADVEVRTLREYLTHFGDAKVSEATSAVDRLKDVENTPSVELTAVVQAPDEAMRTADIFRVAFQVFETQTLAKASAELTKKLKLAGAPEDADPDSLLPEKAESLDSDLKILLTAAGGTPEELPATGGTTVTRDAVPPAEPPVTRFATLRATLDRLSQVDTVVQKLNQLDPILSEANRWAEELPQLVAQYALFADHEGVVIDVAPDGKNVVNAAAAARKQVAEGPLNITTGRTFTNLRKAVEKVVGAYSETIATAWEAWVEKSVPKVDDAELAPFEAHPEYRQTVEAIKAKRTMLRRLVKEPAVAVAGFEEVEGVGADLRTLIDRLPITAPAEVKRFLAATNSKEGAPIDLFSDSVREWLRANNQLEKYRIRR